MTTEQEALLRLSAIPGIGSGLIRALVGKFRSASKVFEANVQELIKTNGVDEKTARKIRSCKETDFPADQAKRMERCGARMIMFWDDEYPDQLKNIYDPPAFLFVRGALKSEDKNSIAVVGTRQPTHYGKLMTEKLTMELVLRGLTIVSGLAYGVDTLAHLFALQAGGRTLAVLGSGVDHIYPNQNSALAKKIIANGAVLSEFPLGTGPDRNNFPRRNRIICGLSLGTLVIEAGEKSGALITAALALDQNRDVFALPGNIDSPKSFGTNALIKQGAKVVTCVEDILEELPPTWDRTGGPEGVAPPSVELNEQEKIIFEILSHEPQHIDHITSVAGKPSSEVLSILLGLELKNVVKQLVGKMFIRT